MLAQDVVECGDKETGSATGRVADALSRLRVQQGDDHGDDVARRAKLAISTRHRELAEQVLVHVALRVLALVGGQVHLVDALNDGAQRRAVVHLQRGAVEQHLAGLR